MATLADDGDCVAYLDLGCPADVIHLQYGFFGRTEEAGDTVQCVAGLHGVPAGDFFTNDQFLANCQFLFGVCDVVLLDDPVGCCAIPGCDVEEGLVCFDTVYHLSREGESEETKKHQEMSG